MTQTLSISSPATFVMEVLSRKLVNPQPHLRFKGGCQPEAITWLTHCTRSGLKHFCFYQYTIHKENYALKKIPRIKSAPNGRFPQKFQGDC